jgi:hypothetical protein
MQKKSNRLIMKTDMKKFLDEQHRQEGRHYPVIPHKVPNVETQQVRKPEQTQIRRTEDRMKEHIERVLESLRQKSDLLSFSESSHKERPYVVVHAKKGTHETHATSSYEAAKKAAAHWKLKSTAGIDSHLADVKHIATEEVELKDVEVNEMDYANGHPPSHNNYYSKPPLRTYQDDYQASHAVGDEKYKKEIYAKARKHYGRAAADGMVKDAIARHNHEESYGSRGKNKTNEEVELDEEKSSTHSIYSVGTFVHRDDNPLSKIHTTHRVTVRRGDDEEKRARAVVAKHYGDTKHEITSIVKGQFNRKKPHYNDGLKEAIGAKDKQDEGEYGYEGDMAMSQLRTIIRNSEEMMKVLKKDTDLPEWVQSKITLATDYLQTANDYLMSELEEEVEQIDEISDKTKTSYVAKATKNIPQLQGKKGHLARTAYDYSASPRQEKEAYKKMDKLDKKIDNRKQGISRALAKEEVEQIDEGTKADIKAAAQVGRFEKHNAIQAAKAAGAPFRGPYKDTKGDVQDKSGAKHTAMSRAKHLAKLAAKKNAKLKEAVSDATTPTQAQATVAGKMSKLAQSIKTKKKTGKDEFDANPEFVSQVQPNASNY